MAREIAAFTQLVAAVAAESSSAAQQALVDTFVEQHPISPLIGADEAIIYYCGRDDEQQVILRGDMLQERSEPLTRLGATRFWFHRGRYESDARLDYHLLIDGADVGDPRNPRTAPSGYGPRAELRMPQYRAPEAWRGRDGVPRGTITAYAEFGSVVYPATRTIWVYTPPGYDSRQRYPSVYFQDGGDYLTFARATTILDHEIAAGTIPPCVAVFVNPSNEHGRVADYDLNLRYRDFICSELVPWIDGRYATQPAANRCAIVGASFGGLIALLIAHDRPDVFGLVGSQSGFVSRADATIIRLYDRQSALPPAIHLIVGTYETQIGPFERGAEEADFLQANRRLRDVLLARGYRHAYAEYHEGHSWGLWRAQLGATLAFLFAAR